MDHPPLRTLAVPFAADVKAYRTEQRRLFFRFLQLTLQVGWPARVVVRRHDVQDRFNERSPSAVSFRDQRKHVDQARRHSNDCLHVCLILWLWTVYELAIRVE